jgi:FtsP/CotA-like multicopper oxidase with cupredoxin domain
VISRRGLLIGGVAAGLLGSCTNADRRFVAVDGPEVRAAEAARPIGRLVEARLQAEVSEVDLGGQVVSGWTYGGRIPGRPIRVTAGDGLKVTVVNRLSQETSVHWHGIAVRNDADGVPMITQQPIKAGSEYVYQFAVAHPGTYWLHPHTGMQLDRGLYAPLIVDDPHEPMSYDDEWIVVLDDWLGIDPETKLAQLKRGAMRGGMMGSAAAGGSSLLAGSGGDVQYPHFLLNGRTATDPEVYQGKPGHRVRIRFINAGADTTFRVAVGGHQMTVTHTDGYPVRPVQTDALLIAMGERYDVLVTLADGLFPLVALAEGKDGNAFALIRTGPGAAVAGSVRPAELQRRLVRYPEMNATEAVALQPRRLDRTIRLSLTGGMMGYDWGFNGRGFDHSRALKDAAEIVAGERVRLEFANATMMYHPVHLHGHTFALNDVSGPRKDTAIVLPGQTIAAIFDAFNPGRWMVHCHNAYHADSGMMTMIGYRQA